MSLRERLRQVERLQRAAKHRRASRLYVAAQAWIAANPAAMEVFENLALASARKKRRFGINALSEVVRWEVSLATNTTDGFKLTNTHRPYIARELLRRHPQLRPYLEVRAAAGDLCH